MQKEFTYSPHETVYSTVDEIVDFLLNNPLSDDIKFSGKVMRILNKYQNGTLDKNFFVFCQSFVLKNGEVQGGEYQGDVKALRSVILDDLPIIFAVIDGKKIVSRNIVTYPCDPSSENTNYCVTFTNSDYYNKITKDFKESKKAVNRYKL